MTAQDPVEMPLFPLHSVLFPGIALPLHVFEQRYRDLVARCVEEAEPFGVVLIRDGSEVGGSPVTLAEVGTTALIREAGRYPDGRLDVMCVGGRRFRIARVVSAREAYLVGEVTLLDEPLGDRRVAAALAGRVGRRFLRYVELLAPSTADADRPPMNFEVEVEVEVDAEAAGPIKDPSSAVPVDDGERHALLMAAARRLTSASDPSALSYAITGLIHVELGTRQALLEAVDTVSRLQQLDALLGLEIHLLSRQLRPLLLDVGGGMLRRN
jgi:uncharacterized protein